MSLKRAGAFCRLTRKLYMDDQLAALSAILFSCNPASVFYSAVYSESIFALLLFSALSILAQWPLLAAALFGLSTAARSNGIVSGIFVGHDGLQRLQKLRTRNFSGGFLSSLVRTCVLSGSHSVGSVQALRDTGAVPCRQAAHHIADSCRRPAGRTAPAGLPMAWLSGLLSWAAPAAAGVVLCHLAIPVRPCAGAVLGRGLPALLPAAAGGGRGQWKTCDAHAYTDTCVSRACTSWRAAQLLAMVQCVQKGGMPASSVCGMLVLRYPTSCWLLRCWAFRSGAATHSWWSTVRKVPWLRC
jgi:Mannosyltransferase (PIG-V)